MDFIQELLKNKEEIIVKVLELIEGKEAKTTLRLDGMSFDLGRFRLKLDGEVEVTVSQTKKKGKK